MLGSEHTRHYTKLCGGGYLFGTVLQYDVDIIRILETVIEADDIGVNQVPVKFNVPGNLK